jgi:cephalosporin-C deacetylase-like acetyl esterase
MRHQFKPSITRPEDFSAFWRSTRMQLEQIAPGIEHHSLMPGKVPGIRAEIVSFLSLGHVRISAYYLRWQDDQPRPLVISSHGYGNQCRPRWDWASQGVNVLSVDIRGFGISKSALSNPSRWGYVLTGIETPETSVIRAAICDYMQAARVGRQLCQEQMSKLVFEGVSFSGGLALMSQAILQQADLLAIGVPTFGWAEGRNLFVKSGSGAEVSRYLAQRPDHVEDTMLVLRYFDAVNFADKINCPVLLALGLKDDVVPAKTVYAIANHLHVPYELIEFPVSHSDGPEEQQWKQFESYWLELALHGLPEAYGKHHKLTQP